MSVSIRLNRESGQRTHVFGGIHTTEKDGSGACLKVIQPQAVGLRVNELLRHHVLHHCWVLSGTARGFANCLVRWVTNAQDTGADGRVDCETHLLTSHSDTADAKDVGKVVSNRASHVDVCDVEQVVDVFKGRRSGRVEGSSNAIFCSVTASAVRGVGGTHPYITTTSVDLKHHRLSRSAGGNVGVVEVGGVA